MTAHLQLARTEGPKAGFNAYMATRVHTAAKRQAEIRSAGNKKAQFAAYCNIFGDQFGPVTGTGAVRAEEQKVEVVENGLVARLASKLGISPSKLASLVEDDEDTVVETPTTTTREIPAAKRISFKMFMALKKIATEKGATLVCTDKIGGEGTDIPADYKLTWNGRKLAPAKASALINESKGA